MKEVIYILVGWSLGLFSPWLAEQIQRPSKKSKIKTGIFVEMQALRAKLASVVLGVGIHTGELDGVTIRWFRDVMKDDKTIKELADPRFEQLWELDDSSIRELARSRAAPSTQTLTFKRYSVPYLEAHLNELSLFSEEFQRLAHQVRDRLTIFNQQSEISWFYFEKTFDSSLSELNRDSIMKNQDVSQRSIARLARLMCGDIQTILKM